MAALPPSQAKANKADKAAKKKAAAKAAKKAAAKTKAEASLYSDTGKAVATGEYAPQIKAVKNEIASIKKHVEPGGKFDQTFAQYQGALDQSTKFLAETAAGAQQRQLDNAQSSGAAMAQAGAEQAAEAQKRMAIFGQTAAAAQTPQQRMGAAGTSLMVQGNAAANQMGVAASNAALTGAHLTAANQFQRQAARTKLHDERVVQSDKLQTLVGKRAARGTELGTEYGATAEKNKLARAVLGQKSTEADRNYKLNLAKVKLQADTNRIQAAYNQGKLTLEQKTQQQAAATAQYNAVTGRQNAGTNARNATTNETKAANDAIDKAWKRAHPNATGSASSGATGPGGTLGRGQRWLVAGRDGRRVAVSGTDYTKAMDHYRDLKHATAGIRQATSGGASDLEKVRKQLGIKDHELFQLAVDIVRKGTSKYTIARKHLPYLRGLFPGGHLPKDIADRVAPK